jgi:hypothetical protein
MRRTILAMVLLALPVGTLAGTHRAGAGGGGGRAGGSTHYGFLITGELVFKHLGEDYPKPVTISGVAELTWMGKDRDSDDSFAQATFVAGGRLTYNSLKWIQPFGHVMAGRYVSDEDSWATALGAGLDFPLGKVTDTEHPHWLVRIQVDNYWVHDQDRSYPQLTGQIVYRLE